MDLDALTKKHRLALQPAAEQLVRSDAFTLETPCVVITDGTVKQVPLSALRNHLRCSVALASEPIERFLRLKEAVGFDAAFEAMSADDEVGAEFVAAWDQSQQDLAGGALSTLNDLVAMVEQARKGWEATPRKLLVVAVEGRAVASGLVPITALNA
jgi:hypothetical protein